MAAGDPLLVFYGDDFTGSTDLVLQYRRFGLDGIIFLGLPTPEQLSAAAADYPVVGIAGVTRALGPADIATAIEPAFRRLADLDPTVLQYKVCSTADSSPTVGSFAPAIRLGLKITGQRPVPVLVAQPSLGRYTVFSNHFAVDRGTVYRLDRQPIMSRHPVTPMAEADLRRHLELQLKEPVGAVTMHDLRSSDSGTARLSEAREQGLAAVVVDALTEQDLEHAARLFLESAGDKPVFAVGSGGLATGIATALGRGRREETSVVAPLSGPCLAVSGSCSALTGDQIRHAVEHGWHGLHLDLSSVAALRETLDEVTDEAHQALDAGRSVVVYTCGDDVRLDPTPVDVGTVAHALASIVRVCSERIHLTRVLIAGGDTSGHVVTALGATAIRSKSVISETLLGELEAVGHPTIDNLEVVLKGGQIGTIDFFERVRRGEGALSLTR